jgi:parallel beta-helix repeat protein
MPAGAAAGASVQLKKDGLDTGSAVSAAADGSYTINGVEAGSYTIEVSLAGYTPGTIPAFNVAGNVTGKNLKLLKPYGGPAFFVKPSAAGDGSGSSWENASNDIQALIDISDDYPGITEIWAAAGTYTPAHVPPAADATTDRDRTFLLKAGVKLYGGFAGNETLLSQRNWTSNPTILSGDFDGDDGGNAMDGFTGMEENAYHVVLGVNIPNNGGTVLDGFTIRGGNADTDDTITVYGKNISRGDGGGMGNDSSSPVLTNVTISGNRASGSYSGGGMYNFSSSPVLTNVTISGNQANRGGGMHNNFSSSPVLTNVTISGNQAVNGGGMHNSYSSPRLTNGTISGNQATYNGGGMYNHDRSSPRLTNVTISGNQANGGDSYSGGGGMYNNSSSSPQIRNSIIWGNGTSVYNSSSTPSYTYSLVEALNPSGTGNLNGTSAGNNPLFADPRAPALSTEGDYHLQAGSPAIDAGSNSFYTLGETPDLSAITTDRDGNGRFNGTVDMGAYESAPFGGWAAVWKQAPFNFFFIRRFDMDAERYKTLKKILAPGAVGRCGTAKI